MVKYLLIALLMLPLAACGQEEGSDNQPQQLEQSLLTIIKNDGSAINFNVGVALTNEQKSKGLMFFEKMPDDQGMLFYFDTPQELRFWMKNTLIPLDLIFIKADGTIHHIHKNAIPHDLTGIPSHGNVSAVLEINGGLSDDLGISVGATIQHQIFTQHNSN